MALTRAQLLMGNDQQGAVLLGEVQAVKQGAGVVINQFGVISVDPATVPGLVRLNNPSAINNYIWPGTAGTAGQVLTLGTGNQLSWTNAGVYVDGMAPPNPEIGDLWFDCSTGQLLTYEDCTSGSPKWTSGSEGLPVLPSDTDATPNFVSGSGTAADPYVCTATTVGSGGVAQVLQTVSISGLAPFQFVPIVDLSAAANGGRFSFTNNVADSAGILTFNIIFTDNPPSSAGTPYTANIKIGYGSVYVRAGITVTAAFIITNPGSISGDTLVGSTLTYTPGSTSGGALPVTPSWVWRYGDTNASFQNGGTTYVTQSTDLGKTIYVYFTATDSSGTSISDSTAFFGPVSKAPFPNPNPPLPPSNTTSPSCQVWDGAATTLESDGCLGFSVNGSQITQGPTPIDVGDTLCTSWLTGTPGDCTDAPDGTEISGCLFNDDYSACGSLNVNRKPGSFTFNSQTAPITTTVTSNTITPTGYNATAYVTYTANPQSGTNIQASKNGVNWTTLQTSGTNFPINPGQTLAVRFTTGNAVGATYNANINIGDGSNVTTGSFTVTTTAAPFTTVFTPSQGPTAIPYTISDGTLEGVSIGTWADGNKTLTSTGCLEFSVNSTADGSYTQGPTSVIDSDVVRLRWKVTPTCGGAVTGTEIVGALTDGATSNNYSFTIDRTPGPYTIPQVNNRPVTTQTTSSSVAITGINAPTYLTLTSATLTGVEARVGAGTFTPVPASGTTFVVNPGESLTFRGTTGGATDTTYNAVFSLGGVASTWNVVTENVVPVVSTPSIVSPLNGATNINPGINTPNGVLLTGTAYGALNTGATHVSSDWETYKLIQEVPTTAEIIDWDPGTVYSAAANISYSGTAALYQTNSTPEALFTGQGSWWIVGAAPATANAATVTFPTPFTGVTQLKVLAASAGSLTTMRIWINGVTTTTTLVTSTVPTFYTINVPGGFLSSVSFGPGDNNVGAGGYISQIVVNGVQLLDSFPTVTLGSNYDLDLFLPGDTVKQDGSIYPGDSFGGGFFAGQLDDGGTIYDFVVSPKSSGEFVGTYKTSNTSDTNPSSQNTTDGSIATAQFNDALHPAFQAAVAANIDGKTDWYIPALNEAQQLYFYFKPDTSVNDTSSGTNPTAYPPRANYASTVPTRAINPAFRVGGAQVIYSTPTSTENPSSTGQSLYINTSSGQPTAYNKALSLTYRFVRKQLNTGPINFNTGIVRSVDKVNNKITFEYYTGSFSANTGNYLINLERTNFVNPIYSTNSSTAFSGGILTIAGAFDDGFRVGDLVSAVNGTATGIVTAVSNTSVTLGTTTGTWGSGLFITCPKGTPVDASLANTSALQFYSVSQNLLRTTTTYVSRVRYNSTGPTLTSDWSTWSKFQTAAVFQPLPGSALGGGFYAGYVRIFTSPLCGACDVGVDYYMIASPRATGQIGPTCFSAAGTTAFNCSGRTMTPEAPGVFQTIGPWYCGGPLLSQQTRGWSPMTNTLMSLTIGGCNDWYNPASYEWISIEMALKPSGSVPSITSSGPNTVPANQTLNASNPGQTTAIQFQIGCSQTLPVCTFPNDFQTYSNASGNFGSILIPDSMYYGPVAEQWCPNYFGRAFRREIVGAPVALGAPYCGGFYAGRYSPGDGNRYDLILAPISGGQTSSALAYGGNNLIFPTGAFDCYYGGTATFNGQLCNCYPLFQFACTANCFGGGLCGKTDWYIPAIGEMFTILSNLGPTVANCLCFRTGGPEAMCITTPYWTASTQLDTGNPVNGYTSCGAYALCAANGYPISIPAPSKASSYLGRLIRRELVT